MSKVAARCLMLAFGASMAACLPDLPGLAVPSSLPATQSVGSSLSPQAAYTPTPASMAGLAPTINVNAGGNFTSIPSLTATNGPGTVTATSLSPTIALPTETATAIQSVSLDELPPGTTYKHVRIENRSRSRMDISLHCTTIQGLQTVLEYEGVRTLSVEAPEGSYVYVVYVGGRQMVGSFSLLTVPNVTITVYADRVAIH